MTIKRRDTQLYWLKEYFTKHDFARESELVAEGIDRKTIQRAVRKGDIRKEGYGIYRGGDTSKETNMNFAWVTKRSPNAVICGHSALCFHELTDQIPRKTSFAVKRGDCKNKISYPPTAISAFGEPYYSKGIETYQICGVTVRIYSIAKSLCDAFRLHNFVSRSIAVEALVTAIRFNKLTPAELAEYAEELGTLNVIEPYLEVMISNG